MSAKVFLKKPAREPSRYSRSHACLNSFWRSSIGNRAKFIVPMLSDATSGLKVAAGRTRSSMVIVIAPPVVMFTTQFERCLITFRKGAKASVD